MLYLNSNSIEKKKKLRVPQLLHGVCSAFSTKKKTLVWCINVYLVNADFTFDYLIYAILSILIIRIFIFCLKVTH